MFRRARIVRERLAAGHETRDFNPVGVAALGCLFLIAMALTFVVATGVYSLFSVQLRAPSLPPSGLANAPIPSPPPQPQLESSPGQTYIPFLQSENQLLDSYGWVDKTHGVVHIPISSAMDIMVSRGLPARSAADGQQYIDKGNSMPSYSSSGRTMEPISP